jgi:hypothetical protein
MFMANAVFPMLGSCRNDYYLCRMQSARQPVQFDKSGRQTRHRIATFIQFFDLFDCLHDQLFGGNNFGCDVFSGDRKHLFLSLIQQRFDFPLLIVTLSRKSVAGGNQPAQNIVLANDIDVVAGIGRGWNKVVELAQIFRSADLLLCAKKSSRSPDPATAAIDSVRSLAGFGNASSKLSALKESHSVGVTAK